MLQGQVLLAFRGSEFHHRIQEALLQEGYRCDAVRDSASALATITGANYDALLLDLELEPGEGLELTRTVRRTRPNVSVVVMAEKPSVDSAVASLRLGISDYLVPPLAPEQVVSSLVCAVRRSRMLQSVAVAADGARRLADSAAGLERSLESAGGPHTADISGFIDLSLRSVFQSLAGLGRLTAALAAHENTAETACELLNCPRGRRYRELLVETAATIEKTKGSFRSKELADLRKKVERALAETAG